MSAPTNGPVPVLDPSQNPNRRLGRRCYARNAARRVGRLVSSLKSNSKNGRPPAAGGRYLEGRDCDPVLGMAWPWAKRKPPCSRALPTTTAEVATASPARAWPRSRDRRADKGDHRCRDLSSGHPRFGRTLKQTWHSTGACLIPGFKDRVMHLPPSRFCRTHAR